MIIDEEFMLEALAEAQKSYEIGEVPVGAVVVKDGEIVGRGHNLRETDKNALRHAELIAIDEACRNYAVGGFGSVIYMSRLSLALCVRVQL